MKLNFWQWLGVVMLLLATPLWIYNKMNERKSKEMGVPSMTMPPYTGDEPTTEPTTGPVTTAPAP